MGDRSHVLDEGNVQTGALQCTDGGFTTGTRALYKDLNGAKAMLHSGLCCGLGSHLRCEGSALPAAAEAEADCGCPGYSIAVHIGNSNHSVVEGGTNVSCTALNVLFLTALAAYGLLDFAFSCCHCLIPSLLLSSAYSALRTLAGTSVLLGALTANGQALTMTNTAIAADLDEALDVHGSLAPEVAFYLGGRCTL